MFSGLGDELLVGDLHIEVQSFRIAECGLDLRMSEPLLHLVDRHPALQGQRCRRVPENVRRDFNGQLAAGDDAIYGVLD